MNDTRTSDSKQSEERKVVLRETLPAVFLSLFSLTRPKLKWLTKINSINKINIACHLKQVRTLFSEFQT